jgi:hypothetical protein
VFAFHEKRMGGMYRQMREQEFRNRQTRDRKLLEKGKLNEVERERYDRGLSHVMPFYYPIPLYYNAYGVGGACVGYTGNVVGSQRSGVCSTGVRDCFPLFQDYWLTVD